MSLKLLEIELSILRDELSKLNITQSVINNNSDIIYEKVFSNEQLEYDHLVKMINEKVDQIRRPSV